MHTALTGHAAVVLWTGLAALLLVSRLLGSVMQRFNQPPVIGALLGGLLLGPSVLGVASPRAFAWFMPSSGPSHDVLGGVAQFSLLMLLVVLGAQTDLPLMRSLGRQAATVTTASIALPFAAGLVVAFSLPGQMLGWRHERLPFALLVAGAIAVSSLPVVARIVDELHLVRRNVGQLALVTAGVNDVFGFLLIALGAALSGSGASSSRLALAFGGLVVMAVGLAIVGQRLMDAALRRVRRHGPNVPASLTVSVVAALAAAALTQAIQIDAALGAFAAGIVLGRSRFHQSQALNQLESWTTAVFAPLYFAYAGLQVDLTTIDHPPLVASLVVVVLVAASAKFLGGFLGSLAARLPLREASALGVLLNGRGAMQVIIGSVGLSLGILGVSAYSVVIIMSLVTSVAVPSLLGVSFGSWPGTKSERERIEKEEELESNVVVRGQRILLPNTDIPNSLAVARVLHCAWPLNSEVTVLAVEDPSRPIRDEELGRFESRLSHVFEGRPFRFVRPKPENEVVDSILAEANLGYGVIAVGTSEAGETRALLSPVVEELLKHSPIPLLVVRRPLRPDGGPRRLRSHERFRQIVVPVTGTATSRAGQEVAHNISRSTGAEVQLVHVVTRPAGEGEPELEGDRAAAVASGPAWRRRPAPRPRVGPEWKTTERAAQAVLEEAAGTATQHDVAAEAELRTGRSSAEEVETVAAERGADLVVLGATVRRVGDRPFLGYTVEHLLEHVEDATVVVVVMPETLQMSAEAHVDRSAG